MANSIDVHVGGILRQCRVNKGMTQTDVGDAVGISFQQIQKYEKGANRIGMSRLWDLSIALDVPITHFFEGLGDSDHTAQASTLSEATLALASEFDMIEDDAAKNHFLYLARILSKRHRKAG